MTAEEKLLEMGYEDIVIFKDYSYDSALIGVSDDNRAIYDYDLMIEYLMREEGWSIEEAADWISYNTLRSLPYASVYDGEPPIVMFRLPEF